MHGKIPLWWPELSKCESMNLGGNFTEGGGGCWHVYPQAPFLEVGARPLAQERRQVCKSL